jgi:hypothetical protein
MVMIGGGGKRVNSGGNLTEASVDATSPPGPGVVIGPLPGCAVGMVPGAPDVGRLQAEMVRISMRAIEYILRVIGASIASTGKKRLISLYKKRLLHPYKIWVDFRT